MSQKHGRHTPAFLLLFLADAPAYGALLLSRMQAEIPYCFADSAIVYRSLQDMEKNGLVEASWKMNESGQPRKWYTITPQGMLALEEFAQDIHQRRQNLEFFLANYKIVTQDKANKLQPNKQIDSIEESCYE